MPAHFDKYYSHHKAEDLFNIVADVEKYPEFLPWVAAVEVVDRYDNYVIADLTAKFKSFSHKYTSKVELIRPNAENKNWEIDVNLVRGPFKHLKTNWIFEPVENGTNIIFKLDFKFESVILEKMIGMLFEKAVRRMTESFTKRADELLKN